MLGTMGADLVGMSTVLEAIACRALDARLLGISLVTNLAAGVTGEALSHAEVLAEGRRRRRGSANCCAACWSSCRCCASGRPGCAGRCARAPTA